MQMIRVTCGARATRCPWRTPGRKAGLGQPAELRWRLEREWDPRYEKPAGRYTKEPVPAGMGGQKGENKEGGRMEWRQGWLWGHQPEGHCVTLETEQSEPEAPAGSAGGGGGCALGWGVWPR